MIRGQASTILQYIRRLAERPSSGRAPDRELLERFTGRQDQAAFAALVERHGPMVWRVCRRVLHDHHATEDAFQAPFLVLARKAGSIARFEALANWLYGVAYRIAVHAKTAAAKRQRREAQLSPRPSADALSEVTRREWSAVMDEELQRLPERLRGPLLLCYLEGQTRDQAAQQLACSVRTLQRRLERGREVLRVRLSHRGVTLSAALVAAGLSEQAASAALPARLAGGTVAAALAFAGGNPATVADLSGQTVALAEGMLRGMAVAKTKVLSMLVLVLGAVTASAGLMVYESGEQNPTGLTKEDSLKPVFASEDQPHSTEKPQTRTDLYGDPLPMGAIARMGTVRLRQGDPIACVAVSPDGKAVVTGGRDDGVVYLWDAATGKEIRQFLGHEKFISCVTFSPDGKLLASAGGDSTIRLWDAATGNESRQLRVPGGATAITFSPDGKFLASGGWDDLIHFWEIITGKEVGQLVGHQGPVLAVAYSADGRYLASGSREQTLRLWEVATRQEVRQFKGHDGWVGTVAFSPDGQTLASGSPGREGGGSDKTVRLWEVATGQELHRLEGHTWSVATVAFSPDGKTLASSSADGIRLWEVATGTELRHWKGHRSPRTVVAFSPDGKTLVSGGQDHTIRLWDVARGEELFPNRGHQEPVWCVVFCPDGKTVASRARGEPIRLWEAATGKELGQVGQEVWGQIFAVSPDGKTLAAGGIIWDLATGKEVRRFQGSKLSADFVAFSPDGRTLAGQAWNEAPHLWEVATGKELGQCQNPPGGMYGCPTFSPDGQTLAAGGNDGTVRLWEAATGRELRAFQTQGKEILRAVAFSPDGKTLAAGGMLFLARGTPTESRLRLWDEATGKEIRQFEGQQQWIHGIAFSPDGRTLASAGFDRTVRLWEVATGKERWRFEGHQGEVSRVAFSPAGRTLASGSWDTTLLVWDVTGQIPNGRPQPAKLSATALEALWIDVAEDDAPKASNALWRLVAAPQQTVPFLQEHLTLAAGVNPERVTQLVMDLESVNFAVREQATQELAKLAELAKPALRRLLPSQDHRFSRGCFV